jgi:acyl phosphate:glycerol-3-phosphate acyltransferase
VSAWAVATVLVAAYGAGAIPWGLILGHLFAGRDLRESGSRSTGATNALRVLGWRISLAVLALDFAKGLLPVVIARWLGMSNWIVSAAAVLTVVGHCWSPFIRFEGGKGMATGAGAGIGMVPPLVLIFPVMAAIVASTRYVSLASLTGSLLAAIIVALAAAFGLVPSSYAIATASIAAIVVARHRGNIDRLRTGTERHIERYRPNPISRVPSTGESI